MAKGEGIFWAAEADKAAMQIYDAIKGKKSTVYVTRRWRLVAWIIKLLPGFIYEDYDSYNHDLRRIMSCSVPAQA